MKKLLIIPILLLALKLAAQVPLLPFQRGFFTTNANPQVTVVAGSNATVQLLLIGTDTRQYTVNAVLWGSNVVGSLTGPQTNLVVYGNNAAAITLYGGWIQSNLLSGSYSINTNGSTLWTNYTTGASAAVTNGIFYGNGLGLTNMQGSNIVGCVITNYYTNAGTFTWYMPTNAITVKVTVLSGGGSGGSGGNTNSGTPIFGGGGGAGGSINVDWVFPQQLGPPGTPITVTVGAGGAAANGQSTQGKAGNTGNVGGDSSFGTNVVAGGSGAGSGGNYGSSFAGQPVAPYYVVGIPGAVSLTNGTANAGTVSMVGQGAGGGAGGGVGGASSTTAYAGGNGGTSRSPNLMLGQSGGNSNGGAVPASVSRGAYVAAGGQGGAGSGGGTTAASANAAAGAWPGGGGGGSGSTQGAYATGNSGAGADGLVMVISFISK